MKTRHLLFLAILLFHQYGYAQTAEDALRYSRIYYGGTARFNGLSGAFGAVGADFSTLATNPAGLGLYRGSEMTFTIAPNIAYTSSTYNGTAASDNRVNFGLGNFGAIFNINTANQPKAGILKSVNIGFGFNRQNDFNNRAFIHGVNMENSLMQSYVNILNGNYTPPSEVETEFPFDIGLAYNANLIVYDSLKGYWCDAKSGGVAQDKTITSYGSINELDFSVGANLADKLFLGFTIGVPFLNYYESSIYRETRVVPTVPTFRSLNYYNDLHTRGTGYNFKFGLIYKPTDWIRIGAAIHSPTWYPGMKDEWAASIQSSFDSTYWNRTVYSPIGYYDYRMKTPFRAMGNIAFIVGQYGLISADYEFVNYSQTRFNSSFDSYSDLNNEIQSSFQSWGNLRLGTEWRLMDFRIRGGFAYFSNPYTGGGNNSERYQFSGGLGYRSKYFFADLTYVYSRMTQSYYLYDATMVNPAEITNYSHSILTTFGVRF
jgi:long-subunit fatty acid transport protein